jgi:hypothetical protein
VIFFKNMAMKKFIDRELAILFRVCTVLVIAWSLCCLWNGVWGYRMDAANKEIAEIYTKAEEDQWAITGGEQATVDSVQSDVLMRDSTAVNFVTADQRSVQDLFLDSVDIYKIEHLNNSAAHWGDLMIAPPELFMLMYYVLATALLIFYPIRMLAFYIRHSGALRKSKNA